MIDDNHLFQRAAAASSAYASMAAFTAAANVYSSFYPNGSTQSDPVNYFACTDTKRDRLDPKVNVKLEDADLWQRFYSLGNEMIITKNGRRLFPNFRVTVNDLELDTKYMLLLDIVPLDDNRYKYQESAWIVSGKAEPHVYGRYYIHPDSPQTGSQWMKQTILFNKVKVTNSPMHNINQILLNSMHRYIIRVHIVQASDHFSIRTGPMSSFIFGETAFIAVTAYQNDEITKLKINNNPFAKGFREATNGKKSHSKPVKRLQTSLPLNKFDENHPRLCKIEPSLLSPTSISPSLQQQPPPAMVDSTTPTYIDQQRNSDSTFYPLYNNYFNEPTSMIYNPSYSYMGSTSSPIHFTPYGCYPPSVYSNNNYHGSFF